MARTDIALRERIRRLLIYCLEHDMADDKSMTDMLAACYDNFVNEPDVLSDVNVWPDDHRVNNSLALLDAMKDCLSEPDEAYLEEWTISRRGVVQFR